MRSPREGQPLWFNRLFVSGLHDAHLFPNKIVTFWVSQLVIIAEDLVQLFSLTK